MRRYNLIWCWLFTVMLTACNPFFRKSKEMEQALEQAKAVYGDGNLEVEVDTVLFIPGLSEAPAFFAGKKQYNKAALAALLNGYTEKDFDKEAAMLSFKDAEYYGELAQDSLTVARAEYWMGKMLYNEYMYDAALIPLKDALALFGRNYCEQSLAMNTLSCCLMLLREYDSAAVFLEQSFRYANLAHSSKAITKTLNNLAVLYELTGDYDSALSYLKQVKPANDEQLLLNYLNLGDVFVLMEEKDSAFYYYSFVENLVCSDKIMLETKVAAFRSLSRFAENNYDFSTALYYSKLHDNSQFESQRNVELKNVYRIQQRYDYASTLNLMNQRMVRRQRIITILSVTISLVIAVLGITLLRLARIRKSELDLKTCLLQFKEQNTNLIGQCDNYKIALEDSEQKLLKARIKEHRIMQKLAIFLDNPSDRVLLHELTYTVWGSKDFWTEAYKLFEDQHPGVRHRLLCQYPNLNEQELKTLVLTGLNASRDDTALLLHISVSMVDKLRNSVRKKVAELIV